MSLEALYIEEHYKFINDPSFEPVKVSAYPKAMRAELNTGKLIQFHNYTSKSLIDRTLEFMSEFKMIKFEGNVYIMRKCR